MHKNPLQNAGNGIKKTTFQNVPGEHAPDDPRSSCTLARPLKISKPVRLLHETKIKIFVRCHLGKIQGVVKQDETAGERKSRSLL